MKQYPLAALTSRNKKQTLKIGNHILSFFFLLL